MYLPWPHQGGRREPPAGTSRYSLTLPGVDRDLRYRVTGGDFRSREFSVSVLRPPAVSVGLAGALCAYLVLFGPLTLFPQVLGAHGASTGLILTALPAGFAIAATTDRLLPRRCGPRARALIGR